VDVSSGENVTVLIVGPATICPGQQVQLTASGADTWLWSTDEVTATIVIDQPGTYTVTGTTGCGSGEASIVVVPGAPPDVAIDGPTLLCGTPVQLTATGADTWLWSTNDTTAVITVDQPGEYTVTGTTACGTDQAGITIVQGEAPLVAIAGDTVACAGSTVQLTATGADSYLWSTQETTAVIEVAAGGTYTVVGTTACGTAQAGVEVIFNGPPTATIDGGTALCPVATLTAMGEGDVLWSTGDTAATIIVTEPGTISLTLTGACGTGSATVDVTDSPLTVHIGADPTEGIAPLPVQFTAHTDEGAGLSWDLGDGATSTEQDPVHTYTDPGEYTVVLTAQLDGCTAQAQALIIVHAEAGIEVPNVFSPNGDGHNDVLQVAVRGIAELDLSLFNRWGQLVYRIERTHQVWDGRTMAGEPVPEGTYFYVVDALALDGTAFREKGHVTVLR
jgi:gliding motility-associated-like protein